MFFYEFGEFLGATIQRNNTRNILDDYALFLEYLWSIFGPQTLKKKHRKFWKIDKNTSIPAGIY